MTTTYKTDSMIEQLLDTDGVIEATSYESMMLWAENKRCGTPKTWVEQSSGWMPVIGFFSVDGEKVAVTLSLSWATIAGKKVLFYESPSRYCDHTLIHDWLKEHCPKAKFADAMNFHNVL